MCTANRKQKTEDTPAVHPLYPNAPLLQTVCEFRFVPSRPWNATIVGLLYSVLRDEFPIAETSQQWVQFPPMDDSDTPPEWGLLDQTRFSREGDPAQVIVSVNTISVGHTRPYPGWPQARPLIERILGTYRGLVEPAALRRIGLRYINRVEIPGQVIELEDYFDFYAHIGGGLPDVHGEFLVGVDFPFEDYRDELRVLLQGVPSEDPAIRTVMLDLDYFLRSPRTLSFEEVPSWLEVAHDRIESAFEGAIKPSLRRIFE